MKPRKILCGICLSLLLVAQARADQSADQIERAQLLREMLETRPAAPAGDGANLPGAQIESPPVPAGSDSVRRQQFEDSQWRNLLGNQQTQINAPASQAVPQSQWRSQAFDRDRRAGDLSADILRRSQEMMNSHR